MCVILQIETPCTSVPSLLYPQRQVEKLGIKRALCTGVYTHLVQIVIHNGG